MKSVRFSKFFIRRTIKYLLISLITIIITIGIYFGYKGPINFKKLFSFGSSIKIKIRVDHSDAYVTKLINNIHSAFSSYFKFCKNSDELLPKTKTCRNAGGFHASILESIETLYLLDMREDYQKALDFMKNEFNCSKLGWVNRHEFWSRGVGSLLGAYTVTGNKLFLNHAKQCADLMLSIEDIDQQNSFAFVNLETQEGKGREWQEGNAASDIAAGLPEIATLSLITNNKKYEDALDTIYAKIPLQESKVFQYYSESGSPLTKPDVVDGYAVSFLYNTVVGVLLKENIEVLTYLTEAISNLPSSIDKNNAAISYPFLDISHYFEICDVPFVLPMEDDLYENMKKAYSKPFYSAFAFDKEISKTGFNFEGAGLRAIGRETQNDEKGMASIIKIVNEAFSRTKAGPGFSGIRKTSHVDQHTSLNNLQSSNLFGQWANIGALAASGNLKLLNSSVFNERGHILRLSFPPQNNS